MTASTTTTISMNGNSIGYGAVQGSEIFSLQGYDNTVLLSGADDTVNILNGQYDSIDLNSTGFANPVTDVINLGASAFDSVTSSHALTAATVSVTASGGPNTVSMVNHGGSTSVSLGNVGDPALQQGLGLGDRVTLNGDATNVVDFTSGGGATIAIGTAGDGFTQNTTTIALSGLENVVTGGDEAFTVTDAGGALNSVTLGNGNNHVTLSGLADLASLGNGDNVVSLLSARSTVTLGGGDNTIIGAHGVDQISVAGAHAGSSDTIAIQGGIMVLAGGDEDFSITAANHAALGARLGNGSNTINLASAHADLRLGSSITNVAHNTVNIGNSSGAFFFNGGVDAVTLGGHLGGETIALNGTMAGTSLAAGGAFDHVTLLNDANTTLADNGIGMDITLQADHLGGFGTVAITGLSGDDLAQIHLIGASAYTTTVDSTALGGITLHFTQGSIDLVGLQSVPNHLFA